MKTKLLLLTALISLQFAVYGQQKYSLDQAKSKLTVEGTSTVHDWVMNSTVFSGTLLFETDGTLPLTILDVRFNCKANKILSDNSVMDNKTHKALNAEKHPDITFNFKSVKSYKKQNTDFSGEITGNLSIAGKSRSITIPFSGKVNVSGIMQIKGVVQLKMTDFNIDPPTAMLGALKTGDEVKISYDFQFVKSIN